MAYNTIKIKKYSDVIEELEAAAAFYPGHLVELTSSGTVQKHSTSVGTVLPMFALEDELQGNGIDDAYAAGDKAQIWIPYRGDIVYAVLRDGESVEIGDFLTSNGDGTLAKADDPISSAGATEFPNLIVGQAIEDKDLSGSSGEEDSGALSYDQRILIRII